MTRFLARRLLLALLVVFLVTVVTFVILHLLPGGPARGVLGVKATPEQIEAFNRSQGFDQPLPVQYWDYCSGCCTATSAPRTRSTPTSARCWPSDCRKPWS
ncbi:hypothetical protein [Kutzneria kofuensis]|uniref:hypothetical protein n=1 Tax=Kutzneria kofuensis TaxID=103725 RepID=UPI0031F00E59